MYSKFKNYASLVTQRNYDAVCQIAETPDVMIFDPDSGENLLHIAITTGNRRLVRTLVASAPGLALHRNVMGCTPFLDALLLFDNDPELARIILRHAPTAIAFPDARGYHPIHFVAMLAPDVDGRRLEFVATHSERGLLVNGITPLMVAIDSLKPSFETIRFLAEWDPDAVGHTTPMGTTALHTAIHVSDDIVEYILDIAPHTAAVVDAVGSLPIHRLAASAKGMSTLRKLIRANPEGLAVQDILGRLPLHIAVNTTNLWKNFETARVVFDAYPEAALVRDHRGRTPAHVSAAVGSSVDMMRMIRAYPHLVTLADERGRTMLHDITFQKHYNWHATACALIRMEPHLMFESDEYGEKPIHNLMEVDVNPREVGAVFTELAMHVPVTHYLQYLPKPCPGIAAALPRALERSENEAGHIVKHMTPAEVRTLRTALLVANRFDVNFIARDLACAVVAPANRLVSSSS